MYENVISSCMLNFISLLGIFSLGMVRLKRSTRFPYLEGMKGSFFSLNCTFAFLSGAVKIDSGLVRKYVKKVKDVQLNIIIQQYMGGL